MNEHKHTKQPARLGCGHVVYVYCGGLVAGREVQGDGSLEEIATAVMPSSDRASQSHARRP